MHYTKKFKLAQNKATQRSGSLMSTQSYKMACPSTLPSALGTPQGIWLIRPFLLPQPPPWGWSTGFMAIPRTTGRLPSHLEAPALPSFVFLCWGLDTAPTVAMQ